MKHIMYVVIIFANFLISAFAAPNLDKYIFSSCVPSPMIKVEHRPGNYATSNDLSKIPGGFENDYANKILLRGIVVDKECVPIPNAKISLWQKDEYGDYRYATELATSYQKYKMNDKIYSEFQGNGVSVSNNVGKFSFITVPLSNDKKTKKPDMINIAINAKGFAPFSTKILLRESDNEDKPETEVITEPIDSNMPRQSVDESKAPVKMQVAAANMPQQGADESKAQVKMQVAAASVPKQSADESKSPVKMQVAAANMSQQGADESKAIEAKIKSKENVEIEAVAADFNKEASDFYGQDVYDFYIVLNGFDKHRRY